MEEDIADNFNNCDGKYSKYYHHSKHRILLSARSGGEHVDQGREGHGFTCFSSRVKEGKYLRDVQETPCDLSRVFEVTNGTLNIFTTLIISAKGLP